MGDDRLIDCVSVLTDVLNYCQERDITCLVIGGDLFHKPGVLHTRAYNLVVAELAKFKAAGVRVLCIPGNHDMEDKAGEIHAVEALHTAGLVEGLVKASFKTWRHEGLIIQGFPYCDSREEFARRIEKAHAKVRGPRIGIFHHGFKGARVGTHLERVVKEHISAKRMLAGSEFVWVASGHYHLHQPILGRENAIYIGSPLEHTRSDVEEVDKGFLVYDAEENDFELVPLGRSRFLDLKQKDLGLSGVRGHFVKAEFKEYPGGREGLEKAIKEAGARAWKVLERKEKAYVAKAEADVTLPPAQAWEEFMEKRKKEVRGAGLNWKKIVRLGRELLQEVGEDE